MEKSSLELTRLKKRRQFLRATHNGKKFVASTMILQTVKQDEFEGVRLGFTVTKKMGNAVVRNRIRRRLKAVAQAVFSKQTTLGYDFVIVARKTAYDAPFDVLNKDLLYLMRLFKKSLEEKKDDAQKDEKTDA
ncbi:MAG: ribonuclease P protein component [Alphaproteobacteria bacterium]|nr:ribonuclease P protein component [Alphaproteobacteria bacterium]